MEHNKLLIIMDSLSLSSQIYVELITCSAQKLLMQLGCI